MVNALNGKKTYIVAVLIGLATAAQYAGLIHSTTYMAIMGILGAGGIASLRHGMK